MIALTNPRLDVKLLVKLGGPRGVDYGIPGSLTPFPALKIYPVCSYDGVY
jgi:hypothetical protein